MPARYVTCTTLYRSARSMLHVQPFICQLDVTCTTLYMSARSVTCTTLYRSARSMLHVQPFIGQLDLCYMYNPLFAS